MITLEPCSIFSWAFISRLVVLATSFIWLLNHVFDCFVVLPVLLILGVFFLAFLIVSMAIWSLRSCWWWPLTASLWWTIFFALSRVSSESIWRCSDKESHVSNNWSRKNSSVRLPYSHILISVYNTVMCCSVNSARGWLCRLNLAYLRMTLQRTLK